MNHRLVELPNPELVTDGGRGMNGMIDAIDGVTEEQREMTRHRRTWPLIGPALLHLTPRQFEYLYLSQHLGKRDSWIAKCWGVKPATVSEIKGAMHVRAGRNVAAGTGQAAPLPRQRTMTVVDSGVTRTEKDSE